MTMPCPEKFQESLAKFGLSAETVAAIGDGFDGITGKSPKRVKAAYFQRATALLGARVPRETLRDLMDWNACCKSGAREKASRAFAKANAALSLDERLAKIPEVPNMGAPVREADGTILVHAVSFWNGERYQCACSNFRGVKVDGPVSRDYCYCCAGHFRFHYEIMLGVRLRAKEIVSSPLDSEGKNPCVIRFEIAR